jgi:hypothetical protein
MRGLLTTVSAVALTAGAAIWWRLKRRPGRGQMCARAIDAGARFPGITCRGLDSGVITRGFLLYYIVPLWLAAGIADWVCHRATGIERTTGAKESLLHLLMLAEVSLPVLAGLFLEITPPVLGLMLASFFLHEATALWDVSYAVTRREVTPIEQHAHSFLEMVPLMALSFIAVLHWPELRALFGLASEPADMSIRVKDRPLPTRYVAGALGANVLFEALPYLEELYRTLRASHGRLVPDSALH